MIYDGFLTISEALVSQEELPPVLDEQLDVELFKYKFKTYPSLIIMGEAMSKLNNFDFTMLNRNLKTLKISHWHLKAEKDLRKIKAMVRGQKITPERQPVMARYVDQYNRIDLSPDVPAISLKHEVMHAASSRTAGLNTKCGVSMVGTNICCDGELLTMVARDMGRQLNWGYELNELYTDYLLAVKLNQDRFQLPGITELMVELEKLFEGKLITLYSQGEGFKIQNHLIDQLTLEELRTLNHLLVAYHRINKITKEERYTTSDYIQYFGQQTAPVHETVINQLTGARLRRIRNNIHNN